MLNRPTGCRRLWTKDFLTVWIAPHRRGFASGNRLTPQRRQEPYPQVGESQRNKANLERYPDAREAQRNDDKFRGYTRDSFANQPRERADYSKNRPYERDNPRGHYGRDSFGSQPRKRADYSKNRPYERDNPRGHSYGRDEYRQNGFKERDNYGKNRPYEHDSHRRNEPTRPAYKMSPVLSPGPSPPVISEDRVQQYFQDHVSEWRKRPNTHRRLVQYGLDPVDSNKLLDKFVEEVEAGTVNDPDYHLQRFAQPHDSTSIDIIYNTVFFSWAAHPDHEARLVEELGVRTSTMRQLSQLVEVTSRRFPADEYTNARLVHRKVIMHVGPTNSGKTHHALRALAAADTGVYAGPLRLLAHEIWQRLNTGQIVPLGLEHQGPMNPKGEPQYARLCNMITGEEQKISEEYASHLSCTVEMLSPNRRYDVAVIDEIQMIGDPNRGDGWTNAVLGIWAKELHLCGEETAVPLVRALLEHTGDEIEVRHYERLTPLVVEEESLKGDLSKIRKGDCIVAFSRAAIFQVKKQVEKVTGLRCAVVYGRLPPETRSEQAALFNDPDSGYDVIVGSDAIGMGLNLKIKRVIFTATSKYDGMSVRLLDVSSVKQIAGRAGRYGLHKEQKDLGGTTTTLYDEDLPHLKSCIAKPYVPLNWARIGFDSDFLLNIMAVLPPDSTMYTIISAAKYIGQLPPYMRYSSDDHLLAACSFLDHKWRDMPLASKTTLMHSPVPWRDQATSDIVFRMLNQEASGDLVELNKALEGTGLMEMLDKLHNAMSMDEAGIPVRDAHASMLDLERLHKVLVFYLWMGFRNSLQYNDTEMVAAIKARLERVLNWTLDRMSRKSSLTAGLRELQNVPVGKNKNVDMLRKVEEDGPPDSENLPLI